MVYMCCDYIVCVILDWIWVSGRDKFLLINMNGEFFYYWEDLFNVENVGIYSVRYIVNSDNGLFYIYRNNNINRLY